MILDEYRRRLDRLSDSGNLRRLPSVAHEGKWVFSGGQRMLNLSSNDYLGLASDAGLRRRFLDECPESDRLFSSSSSRLLTGNFAACERLEAQLCEAFRREAALVFNSGYHANTGILPALADKRSLIVADRLVHASIIDGILLSRAPFLRFRHQDYGQLEQILEREAARYERVFVVTESIFSMDGDVADLRRLVDLKRRFSNVLLYVDEAHAVGVRGARGLGVAEEQDCIGAVDLLVGTFGKALASMGAYLLCPPILREYLVNTMRPLIFSTALPPIQIAWTAFLFRQLPDWAERRQRLAARSRLLADALQGRGGEISRSHIVPYLVGGNEECRLLAGELQRKGFYCLPVRPPTVPKGTSRIRFSLTAAVEDSEIRELINCLTHDMT